MKVVVISDTHNQHLKFSQFNLLPDADMIIHCGDFSNNERQINSFRDWYAELPYKHKILIAGNHDYLLEQGQNAEIFQKECEERGIHFLHDSGVEIEGIKFWGSPWSNQFGNWAFMADDIGLQIQAWDYIPDDTQVLITHGPAKGLGDEVYQTYGNETSNNVGSASLRMTIERLPNLTHHFVGHIHEDFGVHQHPENKFITYNASSWEFYKEGLREPWVFEINAKEK